MEKGQSTFAILSDEYADYGKNQAHYERQERMLNQAYQNGFDAAEDQIKELVEALEKGKLMMENIIELYESTKPVEGIALYNELIQKHRP